ncbi:ATP-binding protein [Salinarimonas sp.]|uniref:ATP-binding protein n=1 Tax=Salinarimonas sp. TaxID=2766526 RepID=UPI003918CCAC
MSGSLGEEHLCLALEELLGPPQPGSVAFLRCLPGDQLDALIDEPGFDVPGWTSYAVVDAPGFRRITADMAVELREDKSDPILLLIDPARAGAGLDGIYSAARELGERELFEAAVEHARARIESKGLLAQAIRKAERIGRRPKLPLRQVFDFTRAAAEEGLGAALSRIGLWPIAEDRPLAERDLDLAASMAERLIFAQDQRTVADRVRALLLEDPDGAQTRALERLLHEVGALAPMAAMARLAERRDLWLGPVRPGYGQETLRAIALESWRDTKGALRKWSGLTPSEEVGGKPRLILDRASESKSDQARLVVRWSTEPVQLARASVDYKVAVTTGADVLAEQVVTHRDKQPQQAVFALEHFDGLDDDAKFEAYVTVAPIGDEDAQQQSEEFVLEFGEAQGIAQSSSGEIKRTLVDGAAWQCASREQLDAAATPGGATGRLSADKKGYLSWRGENGRSVRVARPDLIRRMEEDFVARGGAPGRWIQKVRSDGVADGPLDFVPMPTGTSSAKRLVEVGMRLAAEIGPFGLLGQLRLGKGRADDFATAWVAAVEDDPQIALHGTVEVQTLSGRTIGLVVTPLHPVRLAWQSVYDCVAAHARFEEGSRQADVARALSAIDGAHFPGCLPGIGGTAAFTFADVLGFHAVAMIADGEPEPKAAVAMLEACLGTGHAEAAATIGQASAGALAREIRHYVECCSQGGREPPQLLDIQAWKPGDGATVGRALGLALRQDGPRPEDEQDRGDAHRLCFTLDLHHPESSSASGRFFADVARRRRSGGGVLDPNDRWMTTTAVRPGDIVVPRLRWALKGEGATLRPTHLALLFDVFETRLEPRPAEALGGTRPLHAFGLVKVLERDVDLDGTPEWLVYAPPTLSGERAPDNRAATDRLLRADAAASRATARALGGGEGDWPVLVTRLSEAAARLIDELHECSDWVVTMDRNACVEYFDSPRRLPRVAGRFVIDAVPERADLGSMQLVTSTTNLDALRELVDATLGDMGLSKSERNCRFLMTQLKSLSGRLAIRLANASGRTGELVALALVQAHCANAAGADDVWMPLETGFFVPIDEIVDQLPELFLKGDEAGARRADLLYVRAAGRSGLEFRFVEVKHRQHLRSARSAELVADIAEQTSALRSRWMRWFFEEATGPVQSAVRRSRLARILHFYCDRAARHTLSPQAHARLHVEIDALLASDVAKLCVAEGADRGYIFCPEHRLEAPEHIAHGAEDGCDVILFGPAMLPDEIANSERRAERGMVSPEGPAAGGDEDGSAGDAEEEDAHGHPSEHDAGGVTTSVDRAALPVHADIVLGTAVGRSDDVEWRPSIRANPHLMIVGLPGMGKTTCLVRICRQFAEAGVAPIVFSYHEDIDEKLEAALGPVRHVDVDGLGFNPLRVDGDAPRGHVDVAGTLRDIFGSVFSDLGDVQLEELRQAIMQSYTESGWGGAEAHHTAPAPAFERFYRILQTRPKPNLNLLARLRELHDYGFFSPAVDDVRLLDDRSPTVIRLHRSTNGMLQGAFAAFMLYSIYKDMFRRGPQAGLTHAVVFDEAHRASRLKLLPQLAKECRKFGVSLVIASQESKDFDAGLFAAIGSYLALRLTDADARSLAKLTAPSDDAKRIADRLKGLERYTAMFFREGASRPSTVALAGD